MRKIAAGLFVSVDGVVEAPDTWTGPYFSPELGQLIESMMGDGDTLLLGRVTYQGFAAAFGGQSGGMADRMNAFPKVVVSTTLDRAEWQNTTLISGNVAEEITKLKQRPGPASSTRPPSGSCSSGRPSRRTGRRRRRQTPGR